MINGKNTRKDKYSIKTLNNNKHDVPEHVKYISWNIIEWGVLKTGLVWGGNFQGKDFGG